VAITQTISVCGPMAFRPRGNAARVTDAYVNRTL
jgi:hypothetical protein